MTNELNGNTNSNGLVLAYLVEVYVYQCVCCGVELKLLDDSLVSLTVDSQINYVYIRSVDNLTQLGCGNSE